MNDIPQPYKVTKHAGHPNPPQIMGDVWIGDKIIVPHVSEELADRYVAIANAAYRRGWMDAEELRNNAQATTKSREAPPR